MNAFDTIVGRDQSVAGFVVRLDLPPTALSPNADKKRWYLKSSAAKNYRRSCWVLFLEAKPKDWLPGPIVIDVEYRCHRRCGGYAPHDQDNAMASLKAMADAMRDAGVMPNDSKRFVTWGEFRLITRRGEKPAGVYVTVRRAA